MRAALADPPEGFEIQAHGKRRAFEVLPKAMPSAAGASDTYDDERTIRARLISLGEAEAPKATDKKWLRGVIVKGPPALLLDAFVLFGPHQKKLAKRFVAQAAVRVVSSFAEATSSPEDTATQALQELFDRLHEVGLTKEHRALSEACLASKVTAARSAVAYALRQTPSEESAKKVSRLIRLRYPTGEVALTTFVLLRAELEKRDVADIALELATDWHKVPGCTFQRAEELKPTCLQIAAEAIDARTPGWVALASRPDLPKKDRRTAFNAALDCTLDASAVEALVTTAQELRVAKKTVQRLDKWRAASAKTGQAMTIDLVSD